jgi:hypothetical protein
MGRLRDGEMREIKKKLHESVAFFVNEVEDLGGLRFLMRRRSLEKRPLRRDFQRVIIIMMLVRIQL